jgi:tRNA (guanine-N7-)-methyltransferase
MGRTKTSTIGLRDESEWARYLLRPAGPIDLPRLFENDHPVEVEIGSGKGLFLVNAATQMPDRNFLGIEISHKFAAFTAARLAGSLLRNARVMQGDARRIFAEWLPSSSASVVHVYFPDPWWKRRHKKRRILSDATVKQVFRVLVCGGELRVASDVEPYFHEIQSTINRHGGFQPIRVPDPPVVGRELEYLTNFERKYRKAGKPIWRAQFRRLPDVQSAVARDCADQTA